MSMSSVDSLKAELIASNPEFRDLAKEHQRYEARLCELAALPYPNEDEQLEEVTLKKKKLQIKDKMESIMQTHKRTGAVGH